MRETMDRAWLAEAVELARELAHAYLIEPSEENVQFIAGAMDHAALDCTGKHEFYADIASFFEGLERDQQEAQESYSRFSTSITSLGRSAATRAS